MRSKFYNRNPLTVLRSFLAVVLLLLSSQSFAQTITYSQSFTSGVSPTNVQCNGWVTFCSSLVAGNQYTGFQLTSTASSTVYTCTDATVATAIATAMRTGVTTTQTSDGHTWYVGTGCGLGCGTISVELAADQGTCSCGSDCSIRPQINNSNWGGIGTTCFAPSQTLTLVFSYVTPLSFTAAPTQALTVCQNSGATPINSLLTASDSSTSPTQTWSVISGPSVGTLSGFPATATSGTGVSPTGTAYTPATDYTGTDSFTIQVADTYGNMDATTVYVTVNVLPAITLGAITAICAGNTTANLPFSGITNTIPLTATFSYSGGTQTWTVPAGVTSITVDASGASGGGAYTSSDITTPGNGGRVQATLAVVPGQVLTLNVGGAGSNGDPIFGGVGGFNGGGNAAVYSGSYSGGGGGGATDIRIGGTALSNRVLVAAGGGGGGLDATCSTDDQPGGNGGGTVGDSVNTCDATLASFSYTAIHAQGGTQTAGGSGGQLNPGYTAGSDGVSGIGGDNNNGGGIGGGGGAGYYGGGGGCWTGGAGGSSYTDATLATNVTHTKGSNAGNGTLVITYGVPVTYNISWSSPATTAGFADVTGDTLLLSPLAVATSSTAAAGTYTGTFTVNNSVCTSVGYPLTVTVNPLPVLTTTLTPADVCSNTLFNYGPGATIAGTTFAWSRATVAGITNAAGSGADTINETLVNTTASAVPVVYVYTLTATTGCTMTQNVTVNIKPQPTLTTTLTPAAICDSTLFHYVPASATTGTTFSWSRAAITGITNASGSGIDSMDEVLVNTTPDPITVKYVDTLMASGCVNTQLVQVTVNPKPELNSVIIATPVCDSTLFTYVPTSLTSGTYFSWSRDTVSGIVNGSNVGAGNINETLVNSTTAPITVYYVYNLLANSCSNNDTISVVVNPRPTLTSSLTPPSICDNTMFVYGSMSATANTTYTWSRAAVTGISNAASSGMDSVKETLVNTTPDPVAVVYVDTLSANGCTNTQMITVTVNPLPLLTSTHSPASICDNTLFSYTSSSSTIGTTYSWSRAAMTGIANAAASGIDSISEVLVDTSADPIAVTYIDTLTAYGCYNTENVVVTVNPKPMLSTPLTQGLCDSMRFDYPAASATTGTAFAWTRAYVLGIDLLAGSGVNNPFEFIRNNTNDNLAVVYVYTLTANGCSNTENVTVVSHPTPTLSSNLTNTVCSGSDFAYIPTGYAFGTTFQWYRAPISGLSPTVDTGTSEINETLTNSTLSAINTTYYFTLTANGCTHKENITLTVLPRPDVPQITTYPPSALCSNTMYQNFGTAMMEPAGQQYTWVAENATVYASGEGHQYCLVNFNTPGTAVITLKTNVSGVACSTDNSYTVTVGSASSDHPQVIYFNKQLICLIDNEDTYQWGYDDATTLDSTLLVGEIRPNYIINALDQDHRYYWVITTKDGCMQKSYFNVPATAISNVNATEAMDVKIYPNPATNIVNVTINTTAEGKYTAEVLNILGEKVSNAELTDHKTSFDVKNLPSGCYLVACYRDGVKISASRFIKN